MKKRVPDTVRAAVRDRLDELSKIGRVHINQRRFRNRTEREIFVVDKEATKEARKENPDSPLKMKKVTQIDVVDAPVSVILTEDRSRFEVTQISRKDEERLIAENESRILHGLPPRRWSRKASAVTIASIEIDGKEYRGYALCSHKDRYHGDVGALTALNDLIKTYAETLANPREEEVSA